MQVEQFDNFVAARSWRFAKTYALVCPHFYTMRGDGDRKEFEEAVRFLRSVGFQAYWHTKLGIYYIRGDFYYWTMGAAIEDTTVLNKAELVKYRLLNRSWEWIGDIDL